MSYKAKNVVPKFEDAQVNTPYAFTYGPSDQQQFWDDPDRFNKFKTKMLTFFMSTIGNKCNIKARIEVSPHGRLHLHGYITIVNKMEFYLFIVPKVETYGTLHITNITTEDWDIYCTKQNIDDWLYIPVLAKPLNAKRKKSNKRLRLEDNEPRLDSPLAEGPGEL